MFTLFSVLIFECLAVLIACQDSGGESYFNGASYISNGFCQNSEIFINQPVNQTGRLCTRMDYEPLEDPLPPAVIPSGRICLPLSSESCVQSKYRTIEGSCNNLKNPKWGSSYTRYYRLLPARYADGVHAPPVSVTGQNLPTPRLISLVLFPDKGISDPAYTLLVMQWGQIVTHDLSLAAGTVKGTQHPIKCCSIGIEVCPQDRIQAEFCYPILLPENEPYYNSTCLNFVRTITDLDVGCPLPNHPAEQITAVTGSMDASLIYGQLAEETVAHREGRGGRFIVQFINGYPFPPQATREVDTCSRGGGEPCYYFGDSRGNQNPHLSILQIVLLREHNRLASEFEKINPHWDDETLFQEARRLLIAQHQYITYYQWLPILLGSENMKEKGLYYPEAEGYVEDYREDVDPSTINGHATAAFRFYHLGIQGFLQADEESRQTVGIFRISETFNKPGVIQQGDNFDNLARGLATQQRQSDDQGYTSQLTNLANSLLRAIDIQRSRDHGLASYNDFRQYCGLPRANSFDDFKDNISPEIIEKIKSVYAHHDDVDLIVGSTLEKPVKDTLTGPTNLCIMLEQFYRTRVGDRYFFEREQTNPGAFTPEQLREIRKASISRLLCDNGNNILTMQPRAFELISERNPLVSCNDTTAIPTIDLSFWKEEAPPKK